MRKLSLSILITVLLGFPFAAHASDTPAPSSVTVAGSFQSEVGCPGDWQPDCADTHLVFDSNDNVWQNTLSIPAGAYEYKAALNDTWDENYGAGGVRDGANIGLTLADPANVKFYYSHESHWITDNVNSVIATVPGSYQSEIGCSGDWDPGCLRSWLQDPDGDGIYTFSTNAIPPGSYEAKVAINESWDENYGAGGEQNGPNIPFIVGVSCSEVIFSYNASTHILTVTVKCAAAPICRTAGFWGTHAGEECKKKEGDCGSQNITQKVISDECDEPCLEICGEAIRTTDLDSGNSALEAMCVSPAGDQRLQLASQLTATSLNCCTSVREGDCEGLDVWSDLFTFCNSVCSLNLSDSFSFCIQALDCLNKGGNPLTLSEDTLTVFCQTGTCRPVDGIVPLNNNLTLACNDEIACKPGTPTIVAGPDPIGVVCQPLNDVCSECVPFEETCHTRLLGVGDDGSICTEENTTGTCKNGDSCDARNPCADFSQCQPICDSDGSVCKPGPAGSTDACTKAIGDGKGKNGGNYCAILPKASSDDCSKFNQGEECCVAYSEDVCEACEHDLCETGVGLDLFCDPCVTKVCFEDPSCCDDETGGWSSACVDKAVEICGITCYTIGWANLQWPPTMTHTISVFNRTVNAYGQVWIDGVTSQPGPTPGLWAQLGYGPEGSNPDGNPDWVWVDATFNVDAGNNDEFFASMLPDTVGQYDYLYRYSRTNGLSWLYADLSGPISTGNMPPNPGKLTVNSSGDLTPPSNPTGLLVSGASPVAISLVWDAHPDNDGDLAGFEVYRDGELVARVLGSSSTSHTDTAVVEDASYDYYILAIDSSFNRSGPSNTVTATAALRTVTVTFNVTVPATTDATGRSVYITGSLDLLEGNLPAWDPTGVVLTIVDATHWTITLTGKEWTAIEYKYTLGDWDHVEKGSICEELANRQLTLIYGSNGTQTVNDTVQNWRNVAPCGN